MFPEITRPVDATALAEYMTCPRAFFYSMVMHRRSEGKGAALQFGTSWHTALARHYETDGDELEVAKSVMTLWKDHDAPTDYRTMDRVLSDYEKYRRQFGIPSKESSRTVGWPENPAIEISTSVEGGGLVHPYTVKLDRIMQKDGLVYVQDHKTTSRFDKYYFAQYEMSQQMLGYAFVAKLLFPDLPLMGVEINVSHVLTAKTEFYRQIITFSDDRLREWLHNTNVQFARMAADYRLFMAELEDTEARGAPAAFPGDGVHESFPGHYGDNGCFRKYGACQFVPVCRVSPRIRRKTLELDYAYNEWNPLEVEG